MPDALPIGRATVIRDMAAVHHLAEPRPVSEMSLAELRDLSLYRVMRSLPVSTVSRIGAGLGQILGRRAHPAHDARAFAAIRLLRPDLAKDPHTLEAARTRLWANVGRVYGEFCVLHKIIAEGRATIDDPGRFDAVLADGRRVIVAFAHLGNWETFVSQIVERAPGRIGFLANPPPRNRVRAQIAMTQRERTGALFMTIDGNVWRRALQHLEQPGAILGVAVDELAADRVAIPSFGRALNSRGNLGKIVRMASRTGAIVLPLYSERLAGARFVTRVLPPMEFPRKLKIGADEQLPRIAQLDALFAPAVLRLIDQWFGLLDYR
jgi:KDO2-lipid IV(A) lauroyltransferase